MTDWTYIPVSGDHYDYPDNFNFGLDDDDDDVFDLAWHSMVSRGFYVAEFAPTPDTDILDDCGAILIRQTFLSTGESTRLAERNTSPIVALKTILETILRSTTWEAIFALRDDALTAAQLCHGMLLERA